jgi:hypothetical protein
MLYISLVESRSHTVGGFKNLSLSTRFSEDGALRASLLTSMEEKDQGAEFQLTFSFGV